MLSKNLLTLLNESGQIQLTPAIINDTYILRFCVNSKKIETDDILTSWNMIKQAAEVTINEPLFSLETMNSDKFAAFLSAATTADKITSANIKRKNFSRMSSDPNKFRISIKTKHKLIRAQSFIVADIELISEI